MEHEITVHISGVVQDETFNVEVSPTHTILQIWERLKPLVKMRAGIVATNLKFHAHVMRNGRELWLLNNTTIKDRNELWIEVIAGDSGVVLKAKNLTGVQIACSNGDVVQFM